VGQKFIDENCENFFAVITTLTKSLRKLPLGCVFMINSLLLRVGEKFHYLFREISNEYMNALSGAQGPTMRHFTCGLISDMANNSPESV
jgi:hypothetical protein